MFKLIQILEEKESPFNGRIKVIKTLEGLRITVEEISQSGWLVEKVWNSALKRVKKDRPEIKSVAILGLGGGSAAKLVNKYWPDARITGIDIDPVMVELGKKYLGLSRMNSIKIAIEDAEEWIDKNRGKKSFDLVLIDVYKGARIPEKFTTPDFIKKVNNILKRGGIAAFNHLYSAAEKEDGDSLGTKLREIFPALITVKPEANIIFIGYRE